MAHAESMDDLEKFMSLRLSSRRLELEKSQLALVSRIRKRMNRPTAEAAESTHREI